MKLFKYYPDNINSFKSLVKRGLWCHHPKNMNDPFECLGFLDREISIEKINFIKRQFERSNNPTIKKIIEFSVDQFERFVREQRNRTISQFAFCSLSKSYDNILMWSHYASGHTGFVLGFEFDEKLLEEEIFEVRYLNDLPEFDICNIIEFIGGKYENYKPIFKDISIKSIEWKYENEFRIWKPNPDYFSYSKESLKSIIFGVNCSAETKKKVIELMGDFKDTIRIVELGINKVPLKLIERKTYC